jgi:type IV pilus assembly protein PilC
MKNHTLSSEELASFCSQISILLHAGITPVEGIRILLSDTEDPDSKKLLQGIMDEISKGHNFSESLEIVGVFPPYLLSTIKLGEEAGSIDDVMSSLADYYERETEIADSIKSAITYPLIMIGMMFIIIIILITKVLPIFNQVFTQLGSEITGFAASLMQLGTTINNYSILFGGILVVLFLIYIFFSKTEVGRKSWHKFSANFFLTRKFNEEIAIGRFAGGMALAISTGLDTFSGLDLAKGLVENKNISAKIDICRKAIEKGDSLAEGLKEAGIFSNVNNRMIAVGVKTGETDVIMKKIADEYEKRSEKKMGDIVSVIEPTLVIVLSVIVGLILLSVILPLMGIMANLG